jgi:hypothetical protein
MVAGKGRAWVRLVRDSLHDFESIALETLSRGVDGVRPSERLYDTVAQLSIGPC